jgi:phosphatidate cytidylyltransferase
MANADPARPLPPAKLGGGELMQRVLSALVLAPLAVGVAYLGGWPFVAFWGIAALIVLWEWTSLVAGSERRAILMTGGASVLLAVVLAGSAGPATPEDMYEIRLLAAVTVLAMGMLAAAALASKERRMWVAAGIPYAGLLGVAPIVLRSDAQYGFLAIVMLFAIVWATDILAYFVGRAIGGPKLAPQVSPKKTWSGAIGGGAAAIVAVLAIAIAASLTHVWALALLALILSVVAQAGDLFESAVKRRFGAKDASQLIPGHGGVMDRLDGFMAAAAFGVLIGLAHGGVEAPARGLLVW